MAVWLRIEGFTLTLPNSNSNDTNSKSYSTSAICRASKRLNARLVEKEVDSIAKTKDTPLPPENKGRKMLERMGFTGGSLGLEGGGITDPIKATKNLGTRGLGAGFRSNLLSLVSESAFTDSIKARVEGATVRSDVEKARMACMTLDETRRDFNRSGRETGDCEGEQTGTSDGAWYGNGRWPRLMRRRPDELPTRET